MTTRTEIHLLWLPIAVWLAYMFCVGLNARLLRRYREAGQIPPRSLQSQFDILFGRYDHLPRLAALRRTSMLLIGVFVLSALGVVLLNTSLDSRRPRQPEQNHTRCPE